MFAVKMFTVKVVLMVISVGALALAFIVVTRGQGTITGMPKAMSSQIATADEASNTDITMDEAEEPPGASSCTESALTFEPTLNVAPVQMVESAGQNTTDIKEASQALVITQIQYEPAGAVFDRLVNMGADLLKVDTSGSGVRPIARWNPRLQGWLPPIKHQYPGQTRMVTREASVLPDPGASLLVIPDSLFQQLVLHSQGNSRLVLNLKGKHLMVKTIVSGGKIFTHEIPTI